MQISVATKNSTPNLAVAFAWIGTMPAMFYSGAGFWRRFAASLVGSVVSLIIPFGVGILNAMLLQNAKFDYLPIALLGAASYLAILNLSQLAVAYAVARAIVRRGLGKPKTSTLATA